MTYETKGIRHDVDDLFKLAPSFTNGDGKLVHNPFLVIEKEMQGEKEIVSVKCVRHLSELNTFADEALVLVKWPGNYSSDYFQFTIGDWKNRKMTP